jgi:DNA topoisomerase-1
MPPKFYKKKPYATPKTENVNYSATFLIIVESPSKCKKIESFLGTDYCCIASKGHIRTLDGLKSIDTKGTFEPSFTIIDEKKAHVEFMREVIGRFSKSNIILASDDDREGEAIAWHICKVFCLPIETTPRIIFHEITESAIRKAVGSPGRINMNLVYAQHARQVLDVIVGYKISPFLWKYLYHNKSNSLSAGRCQTPALRLVYDNEKEKKVLEKKYKTIGKFFSTNTQFELNYEFDKEEEIMKFLDDSKVFKYALTVGDKKQSKSSPPKPFTTSRLLQVASNTLHISPKETMSLCQQLYQEGYITYMRTESAKYSPVFLEQCKKHIIGLYEKTEYVGNLSVLENKDINNPHEAIRVTHISTSSIKTDNVRLASMYKVIWKNSIESCMSESVSDYVTIKITAPLEKWYSSSIETPVFLGWKMISEKSDITELQSIAGSQILRFQSIEKSGVAFTHNTVESSFVGRNKHQHYTEATLIHKLEELGIGRPSTFATIVETIQERGYVLRTDVEGEKFKCKDFLLTENVLTINEKEKIFGNEKNKLVLQNVGLITVEFLIQNFENMFSYNYTKNMEDKLDEVSTGKQGDWATICKQCYQEIKDMSKPLAKIEKQVYSIDEEHVFVFEKYGPVIRSKNESGEFEYKPVKKTMDIDLDVLKSGGYSVDDLIEIKNGLLGIHEGKEVYLKSGKYGPYVECGEKRESVKGIEKTVDQITLEDILPLLTVEKQDKNILRKLNDEMSVRRGQFGNYVFYKSEHMTKPEFINIKKFKGCTITCDAEVLIKWALENRIIKSARSKK